MADLSAVIARAREFGLKSEGDDGFAAAVAINRVCFDGQGMLVAALNEALAIKGGRLHGG